MASSMPWIKIWTEILDDHKLGRQNGKDELDNLVAACQFCNCSKGGRTPDQAGMELING